MSISVNENKNHFSFSSFRLRSIIERLLDLTNQSWLYIGKELTAMTLQSPSSSSLCVVPNRSLLTIHCQINDQGEKVREKERENIFRTKSLLDFIDDFGISIQFKYHESTFIISNHCLSTFDNLSVV